jgi:hypothetical protein
VFGHAIVNVPFQNLLPVSQVPVPSWAPVVPEFVSQVYGAAIVVAETISWIPSVRNNKLPASDENRFVNCERRNEVLVAFMMKQRLLDLVRKNLGILNWQGPHLLNDRRNGKPIKVWSEPDRRILGKIRRFWQWSFCEIVVLFAKECRNSRDCAGLGQVFLI